MVLLNLRSQRGYRAAIAKLRPESFSLVMATGILSLATASVGWQALSLGFFAIAGLAYAVLVPLSVVQFARRGADLFSPDRAFGFFTFPPASTLLAMGSLRLGLSALAIALVAAAALVWLVFTYAVPVRLTLREDKGTLTQGVNGGWLLWTVATQSVSIGLAAVDSLFPAFRSAIGLGAVSTWAVGTALYGAILLLVIVRLLGDPIRPVDLSPDYWISMGAAAITVLAGARLAELPRFPSMDVVGPVVQGTSLLLWGFASWWIPLLILFTVWRHVVRHLPFRYEVGLWAAVFPLGMYAECSFSLGHTLHLPSLVAVGAGEVWLGLAAWLTVAIAMAAAEVSIFLGSPQSELRPEADSTLLDSVCVPAAMVPLGQVETLPADLSLAEFVHRLGETDPAKWHRYYPVTNAAGDILGIFERDRVLGSITTDVERTKAERTTVATLARPPQTIREDQPLAEALHRMQASDIKQLLVEDMAACPIGIIDETGVLAVWAHSVWPVRNR